MKRSFKNLILTAILLFTFQFGFAQSFNYTPTSGNLGSGGQSWINCSSGTEITGADVLQDQGLGDKLDDGYAEIAWPFNFQFYDSYYFAGDNMYLCTNGFIRFDDIPNDDATATYNNSISSYSPNLGEIVSFAMEDAGFEATTSHAYYKTTGSAPNRIFTVELKNLEIRFDQNKYVDVQVSFYETTNEIVIRVGAFDVSSSYTTYLGIHSGNNTYKDQWGELQTIGQNKWRKYTAPAKTFNPSTGLTVTQASTAAVYPSSDNPILRLEVAISGGSGVANLADIAVTAVNDNDADVGTVKLYHTKDAVFNNDHQVWAGVTISGGKYSLSGAYYNLPGGTSYLWVTYDINSSAVNGNDVDGKILQGDINNGLGAIIPVADEAPTGLRTISYFEWVGTTSTNWTVGTNWSTSTAPTASDNVIIPSAPTNQPHLPTGNNGYCNNLKIESGAIVTVENTNKNLRVYGDVDNEGTLDVTGTYNILLFGGDNVIKGSGTYTTARFRLRGSGVHYTLANNVSCYRFRLDDQTILDVGDYDLVLSNDLRGNSGSTINTVNGSISVGTKVSLGNFSPGTGTFFYNGNNSRTIVNKTYYTLKVRLNSGTRTLTNVSSNMENLELVGLGTAKLASNIAIDGNFKISDAGCTLNQNGKNINLGGDWTNNGVAVLGGASTVTFDGKGSSHINGNTSFYKLAINKNTGDVHAEGVASISNILTLAKGIVFTSDWDGIIVEDGATVSGGSATSFVSGKMTRKGNSDFKFPIGEFRKYAPMELSTITLVGGTVASITAEYHAEASSHVGFLAPLTAVSQNEHWRIHSITGTVSANIRLFWEDATWSGIGDASTLRVAEWAGVAWVEDHSTAGGISAGNKGSIITTSISDKAVYTFGTIDKASNPLPIELLSFDAIAEGNNVLVDWKTASEENNEYFIVERSKDGINSEFVGRIEGAGNSNQILTYSIVDENPYNGISYYRLAQYDYDGKSESFSWVAVHVENKEVASVQIYPNPLTTNSLNLDFQNFEGQTMITIYDFSGRKIMERSLFIESASSTIQLPIDLPNGTYNIQLINAQNVIVKKLIVN